MKPASQMLFRAILVAALAALLGAHAAAQSTGARPDRGVMPGASYSVSGIDSVSLTNGNVSLSVPLASLPPLPGGKLGLTLNAVYNSKLWDVRREEKRVSGVSGFATYVEDIPQLSSLFIIDAQGVPGAGTLGGWRITGKYRIVIRDASQDYGYQIPPNQSMTTADDWAALQYRWYKAVLVTPDGAEHELRPTDSINYYGNYMTGGRDYLRNYYRDTPDTTGAAMRYYSSDGSYLSAIIYPQGSARRWVLFMPGGTQVVQEADTSGTQLIRDADGNGVKIFTDTSGVVHYQDERNTEREIKVSPYDQAANGGQGQMQVSYRTVGGAWANINLNFGTTRVRGQLYKTEAQDASGGTCQVDKVLDESFHVLREIVYPATEPGVAAKRYSFGYNSDPDSTESFTTLRRVGCGMGPQSYTTTSSRGLGALNRVATPTGATIDYSYSLSSTHHYFSADTLATEMITSKKITHDGTADIWTYDVSPSQSHGTVTNPDGTYATETAYQHDPIRGAFATQTGELAGLVYRSKSADVTVERRWALMPFAGANTRPAGSSTSNRVNFNPVITEEYTTLTDGNGNALKMSARRYRHDYNGNVTEVKEYDWFDPIPASGRDALGIPNAVPGDAALLRTTTTTYHHSPADATSASVYAKRTLTVGTPSIIDAPMETTTGPSITRFSYDGQEGYEAAPIKGHVTEVSSFDDQGDANTANDRWVTTKTTYDPTYGNVSTSRDANGNETSFSYEDDTHALPTKTVVDPLNDTGAQTTLTSYDKWTGLTTSTTDANLQTTTIDYTNQLLGGVDPFGRPGWVAGPAVTVDGVLQRRKVFTTYEDSLRRVTVESDLRAEGDGLLKNRTTSDQLGRTVLTEQSEDGSTYTVSIYAVYEEGGRYIFTSNPMRATAAPTDGWTRMTKDTAGRVTEVVTFAGADRPEVDDECLASVGCTGKVTTVYDGEFMTVTDQAGKVRRGKKDALGRLRRVDEPSDSNNTLGGHDSPTQPTAYAYDVLGNLTLVRQGGQLQLQNGVYQYVGGQTRTFTYGSLSRLSSATNPEGGKVSYEYDEAGNLKKKVDPRLLPDGTTHYAVTYEYDGFHRVKTRTYNDGTPTVTYSYDKEYTDHQNVIRQVGNARGRLTQVRSSVSAYNYTGYDALGRVTGTEQVMPNADGTYTPYTMPAYKYDLAGNLVSEQYPSGRVVKTEYDAAGRVAGVKNPATGLYYAGGALTQSSDHRIQYTAGGAASAVRLGNGLWEHTSFNSRLQTTQIGLGTTTVDSSTLKLDYTYGVPVNGALDATKNNGNLRTQTITVPGVTVPFVQTYEYDELNRLKTAEEKTDSTSNWKQVYTYDRFGNRTLAAGTTYPATLNTVNNPAVSAVTNRISSADYSYDPAGNLLCDPDHQCVQGQSSPIPYYAYDAENKMKTAGGSYDDGGTSYSNDGDGRRVKKATYNGEVTVFVYDVMGRVVAEYSTHVQAKGTRYLTQDQLGSTRVVTDAQGNAHSDDEADGSRHDYFPFGEEIGSGTGGRETEQGYGQTDNIRQKFTGYEHDGETGLTYAQARYYSAATGRYTSVDPIQLTQERLLEPQGINLYAYAKNNPFSYVDPSGMDVIRLGRSVDAINQDIASVQSKLKGDLSGDAKQALEKQLALLQTELKANEIIGAWLAAGQAVGELKDVKLSDLSIMTSPKEDMTNLYNTMNQQLPQKSQSTSEQIQALISPALGAGVQAVTVKGEIYIYADNGRAYSIAGGGRHPVFGDITPKDVSNFGASIIGHERHHKLRGAAEPPAFAEGLRILLKFTPDMIDNKQWMEAIRTDTAKKAGVPYPPQPAPKRRRR
ncbi:MAG: RHS repeat-associated core domain-containing protein [Pyrinomonadaceae bacterium]